MGRTQCDGLENLGSREIPRHHTMIHPSADHCTRIPTQHTHTHIRAGRYGSAAAIHAEAAGRTRTLPGLLGAEHGGGAQIGVCLAEGLEAGATGQLNHPHFTAVIACRQKLSVRMHRHLLPRANRVTTSHLSCAYPYKPQPNETIARTLHSFSTGTRVTNDTAPG